MFIKLPPMITALFWALLCRIPVTQAQTLGGVPGLVQAPTADFMRDGAFYAGAAFLPKELLEYTGHQRDGLVIFSSLTFLPFLELDLRLTRQLALPPEATHTVDRSPGLRLRLLRQSRSLPALVLGFHDLFSTVEEGRARHFAATYVVMTKQFSAGLLNLTPSIGYSHPLYANRRSEFEGFYGGVQVQPKYFSYAVFLAEYLNMGVNMGVDLRFARWLRIKLAMLDARYFSCNASMHFNLFVVFKH